MLSGSKNVRGTQEQDNNFDDFIDTFLSKEEMIRMWGEPGPVQLPDMQPTVDHSFPGSCNEIYTTGRSLQLRFSTEISSPVLTGKKIKGEGSEAVQVVLIDGNTGKQVDSGPEAFAEVEIVVLKEAFASVRSDDWTIEEFDNNIVRGWKCKKSLLAETKKLKPKLKLKEGCGILEDISFTHDRNWLGKTKFRLGARIVGDLYRARVREAKTELFELKDCRLELYKKHHPPSLFDEVWRLEKIGKGGAFHKRLNREKVKTVKDFLILLFLDPTKLRNILGTGMSAKMWEVTAEHARTCVLDNTMYLYCPVPLQRTGVVFNTVGQVLGLLSDTTYHPADKISEIEKADAQKLIITAFQYPEKVIPYENVDSLINGLSCLSDDALHQLNSPATNKEDNFGQPQLTSSSHDMIPSIYYSMGATSSLEEFCLSGLESMDHIFDQPLTFQSQVSNSLICDTDSLNQVFCEDDNQFQFFDTYTPSFDSEVAPPACVDSFLFPHNSAHRRWIMLSNVIKLMLIMFERRERCHPVF